MFRNSLITDIPWTLVFISTVWAIWKTRNRFVFEGKSENPMVTLSNIKAMARDWAGVMSTKKRSLKNVNEDTRWKEPPPGWMKLNTDGSLLRDNMGGWSFGFSMNLGACTITEAELLALRMGLTLAWERRIEKLEVELDSQVVINLIKNTDLETHALGAIIEDCRRLLRNPWTCVLKHTLRNGNKCADALAKLGYDQSERTRIWDIPPESLVDLLVDDFG
ncbi:hypothetical protein ACJIZ3_008681 [Penstemon smallii]|uniref:RNase H type-1 domain-containing protein n=1 Tax=Penstemon smallii TaxID=265156 RepID=A0ABD3TAF0_9LAMI